MPSGRIRTLLFPLLWFLSKIYALVIFFRHFAYDHGLFKITKLSIPVISIGNIAAGGSGKSPFTVWLAKGLQKKGLKVAILSRGYGRSSKGTVIVSRGDGVEVTSHDGGDEPVMMAKLTNGIPIVVDANRVRGGKLIENEFSPDLIIMDDAMQHRKIHRDLDIALWNSHQRPADLSYLPLGHQRDLYSRLKKMDFLLLTKVSEIGHEEKWKFLEKWHVIDGALQYDIQSPFNTINGDPLEITEKSKILAFAGTAFPEHFFAQLQELIPNTEWEFLALSDHYEYNAGFREYLQEKHPDIDFFLTTEKDYAKIRQLEIENLYVVPQTIKQISGSLLIDSIYERLADK